MLVYLNGEFIEAGEAKISVFDRGFLFGDAVYEVVRFFDGRPFRLGEHLERMRRSLHETKMDRFDIDSLHGLSRSLLERSGLRDATIYWQISRGDHGSRSHLPTGLLTPTVFGYAEPAPSLDECYEMHPMKAVLTEDIRWRRCDIKSNNLLGNILAKMDAAAAGADEAIQHLHDRITEGASTNLIIVTKDREIATPPLNDVKPILEGVTRRLVLDACPKEIVERPVTVDEVRDAAELILLGTRTMLGPVVELDGRPVGEGTIGPTATRLAHAALALARTELS